MQFSVTFLPLADNSRPTTYVLLLSFTFTFSRNGKFVETGEHFWFPDDVTLGYIIGTRWNLPTEI